MKGSVVMMIFRTKRIFIWVMAGVLLTLSFTAHAWFKKYPYNKEFKRWTREEQLYQRPDFYASITWTVTFLSPKFIEALGDEIARIYDHSAREKSEYHRENLAKFDELTPFFVSFYAYDRNTMDLTQKYPSWKVRLVVNGRRYDAVRVEKIAKPDVLTVTLFPYVKAWANHYYLYFPKVDLTGTTQFELSVDGPYAKGRLSWLNVLH